MLWRRTKQLEVLAKLSLPECCAMSISFSTQIALLIFSTDMQTYELELHLLVKKKFQTKLISDVELKIFSFSNLIYTIKLVLKKHEKNVYMLKVE